jgi:hypothetical protein
LRTRQSKTGGGAEAFAHLRKPRHVFRQKHLPPYAWAFFIQSVFFFLKILRQEYK